MRSAVIFGGGKIARGFVAQLLHRSGFFITFVEQNEALAQSLNESGKYYVNVMGNTKENEWITDYICISPANISEIAQAMSQAEIIFTSVGGKNLEALAGTIAKAYILAASVLSQNRLLFVTCENWMEPAKVLRKAVLQNLEGTAAKKIFEEQADITEAVIIRSGVEAVQNVLDIDKNAVSVTDYWELPIDRNRIRGKQPEFMGVKYEDNFQGLLERKFYTFNATNAAIAYIGSLKGITVLWEAANNSEILEILVRVHEEINPAIAKETGVSLEEQKIFAGKALRKYQDKNVLDFLERHARDPIRKLGPSDRIMGPLRLAEKYGLAYEGVAAVLAAALYYHSSNPEDPTAEKLSYLRKEKGVDFILQEICKISPNEKVFAIVKAQITVLKKKGWLHE